MVFNYLYPPHLQKLMKKVIYLLCTVFLLSSCSSRLHRILNKESIDDEKFVEVIPFNYQDGLPLIEVEINGKSYNFLFDTGAPMVIDKRIVEEINFKKKKKYKVTDSNGRSQQEYVGTVNNLKLGSRQFQDVGAFVMDLRKSEVIACFQLDGIIGANLMAQCKWSIDYKAETMTFQDNTSPFSESGDISYISFKNKYPQRTPLIDILVNDKKIENITFDTGATGALSINSESIQEIQNQLEEKVYVDGISSSGAYGSGYEQRTTYSITHNFAIDSILFGDLIIKIGDKKSQLLGNQFFENYIVHLDWSQNRIGLEVNTEEVNFSRKGYGFSIKPVDGQLFVGALTKNSIADKIGLKLNDETIKVNGVDVSSMTESERCELIFGLRDGKQEDIKIITRRGDITQSYILKYQTFLES